MRRLFTYNLQDYLQMRMEINTKTENTYHIKDLITNVNHYFLRLEEICRIVGYATKGILSGSLKYFVFIGRRTFDSSGSGLKIKMVLKFCANLSFMFQETASLLERYELAKQAGFKAVECAFPYDFTPEEVAKAKGKAGVQQVLINAYPGDWSKGSRGLAAIPGKDIEFKSSMEKTVEYAQKLECKMIHIMAGTVENETPEHLKMYKSNLSLAAKILRENDMIGVIEPINKYSLPNYYLNNYEKAISVINDINSPNIKLQLDLFHLQQICGNLTKNIEQFLPIVGHIQIAQVPDRHEPSTPGEINYSYIFQLLKKLQYDGWIGLEYSPLAKTQDGLKWISELS